jgi:hypothetical protein
VPKDVEIAVVGADLKAAVTQPVPLVYDLGHFKRAGVFAIEPESHRALVSLISGKTFHVQLKLQGRILPAD